MKKVHEYIYEIIGERMPKKEEFKIRKDGKFSLVLQENVGIITSLNETASFIINNCDGKTKIKEMAEALCSEYPGADKGTVKMDVTQCVRDLEAMRVLNIYK